MCVCMKKRPGQVKCGQKHSWTKQKISKVNVVDWRHRLDLKRISTYCNSEVYNLKLPRNESSKNAMLSLRCALSCSARLVCRSCFRCSNRKLITVSERPIQPFFETVIVVMDLFLLDLLLIFCHSRSSDQTEAACFDRVRPLSR